MIDLSEIGIGAEQRNCRLCDGETSYAFNLTVREKHPVSYWECRRCGSLQTEEPYWLDETYQTAVPTHDLGMVARTLQMTQVTSALLRVAGVTSEISCLDFGGGNGLFCRMMRDQAYNFFCYDKYASQFYSSGFAKDLQQAGEFSAVTSFEVFEHLPNPKINLQSILAVDPKLWILSTQLYRGQKQDWNYLAPAIGGHVFFYSEKAMGEFARKHGFLFMPGRYVHMFVRQSDNAFLASKTRLWLARQILAGSRTTTLGILINFEARQRTAYRRWQADRDALWCGR